MTDGLIAGASSGGRGDAIDEELRVPSFVAVVEPPIESWIVYRIAIDLVVSLAANRLLTEASASRHLDF
jgi:hypothetical protein